jgi:hypothetical protein
MHTRRRRNSEVKQNRKKQQENKMQTRRKQLPNYPNYVHLLLEQLIPAQHSSFFKQSIPSWVQHDHCPPQHLFPVQTPLQQSPLTPQ